MSMLLNVKLFLVNIMFVCAAAGEVSAAHPAPAPACSLRLLTLLRERIYVTAITADISPWKCSRKLRRVQNKTTPAASIPFHGIIESETV
jgi:hypothetical protein